jgi:RecB family exonuclease
MSEIKQKTVSYSQFSLYAKCPLRWKLDYIDNLRTYEDNINTLFGTAFHNTVQHYLQVLYAESAKKADEIDLNVYLQEQMYAEYKKAVEKKNGQHFSTPKELAEFLQDGIEILKYLKRHRRVYFPSKQHKLMGVEIPLSLNLKGNIRFIGFIDIVIHDERNNRIKVWDIKTSTSGWNKYQKADQTKTAQLILYKEFYAKQYNWDPELIDVEYLIVRRRINENAEFVPKRIQLFAPASGKVTRNKIGRMFQDFLDTCFTEDGQYNTEAAYPAIETSACRFCPFNRSDKCNKKDRLKG